jgi:hypothetical protein
VVHRDGQKGREGEFPLKAIALASPVLHPPQGGIKLRKAAAFDSEPAGEIPKASLASILDPAGF